MSNVSVEHPRTGVALVTLDRPEKYNALSPGVLSDLQSTFASLAQDEELRCVVLTGAGSAFCAGLDLGELEAGADFDLSAADGLRASPVPVIGAVNGVAVTGGLELALACDFRIASERARFADTHGHVGAIPAWGLSARLPQAVGQAWARQMSLTGDFVDAGTALRIGLVNEVVPHEALLDRALELAGSIAETNRVASAHIRRLYDVARDEFGGAAIALERELSPRGVSLDSAATFAERRSAVFARGRAQ